jgi:DNA-binding response OmpR family regulator
LILLVDDVVETRESIGKELGKRYRVEAAGDMATAWSVLAARWAETALIIMDIMLPEDDLKAKEIDRLTALRDEAYTEWLPLAQGGADPSSEPVIRARFKVDALDSRIFANLSMEGGVELIERCVGHWGGGEPVDKPVIYFTARENEVLRGRGVRLVRSGRCDWLVKPIGPEEMMARVDALLRSGGAT